MISSLNRPWWWLRRQRNVPLKQLLQKQNYATNQEKQSTPAFIAEKQSISVSAKLQSTPVCIAEKQSIPGPAKLQSTPVYFVEEQCKPFPAKLQSTHDIHLAGKQSTPVPAKLQSTYVRTELLDVEAKTLKPNYATNQEIQNDPVLIAEKQSIHVPAKLQSTPVLTDLLDVEGKTLKQALSHQDPALIARIVQAIPPCRRTRLHMDQLLSLMDLLHTMEIAIARVPAFIRKAPFMYQRDPVLHLLPKILFLETLGLHREHMQKLFLHYPYSLYPSLEEIQAKIQFLRELSLSDHDLCTVILKSPMAFRLDAENHLQPRLSLLTHLGVSMADIRQALLSNSRILSVQSNKLQKTLEFLHSLGLNYGTSAFSKAVLRCGPWNCEIGFRNLLDAGFSESQVGALFLRSPSILTKSRGLITSKLNYLVQVMQRDQGEVLKCPEYFQLSLERRIRPRHEALELWKAQRQVKKKTYSLSYIFLPNDRVFSSQFPGIEVKINNMKACFLCSV